MNFIQPSLIINNIAYLGNKSLKLGTCEIYRFKKTLIFTNFV